MTRKIFFKWQSERDNTIKYQKFGYHIKPFAIGGAVHVIVLDLKDLITGAILFGIVIIIITCLIIRRIKRKKW